jgi:hypothetical protein
VPLIKYFNQGTRNVRPGLKKIQIIFNDFGRLGTFGWVPSSNFFYVMYAEVCVTLSRVRLFKCTHALSPGKLFASVRPNTRSMRLRELTQN